MAISLINYGIDKSCCVSIKARAIRVRDKWLSFNEMPVCRIAVNKHRQGRRHRAKHAREQAHLFRRDEIRCA